MVRNFVLAVALASAVLAGCGGDPCSDKGKCSNDAAPDSNQVAACQKASSDATCGGPAKSLATCLHDNEQCASDGSRDDLATLGKCTRELADLQNCCNTNPSSAACTAS